MMKHWKSPIAAALLAGSIGYAWAQGYVRIPTLSGSEVVSVTALTPSGQPAGGNQVVYLTQIRDAQGYSKQVATSSSTVTVPANVSRLILNPAGSISTVAIVMPPGPAANSNVPVDGAEFCLNSTQNISSGLSFTVPAGHTINGTITSFTAGTTVVPCWVFSASNLTWDRSQ